MPQVNGIVSANSMKSPGGNTHRKRICINNAAEAARFHNVHPGINHPIIYDDRVVMVVGISGDPAAISRYAELAVLTAELLVRQAIEMRETTGGNVCVTPCFVSIWNKGLRPPGKKRFIACWNLVSILIHRGSDRSDRAGRTASVKRHTEYAVAGILPALRRK